jgi:hypothetical protein
MFDKNPFNFEIDGPVLIPAGTVKPLLGLELTQGKHDRIPGEEEADALR